MPHGSLERDCTECHSTEGWRPLLDPILFRHGETGFPLVGSHRGVECTSCHRSLDFPLVPTSCADCHADPHRGEVGFRCEDCHAPAGWDNRRAMFEVHGATRFALSGVHATLDCAACHQEGPPFEYSATPVECFACHVADYLGTEDPDHQRAGFPQDCEACHNSVAWEQTRFGAGFDHSLIFPLTGAHRLLDCQACHADGYAGTSRDCYACHRNEYESTRDPNHRSAGFPTDCEQCHTTQSWQGAVIDHDQFFRLTGAHRGLDCLECHSDGYAGTPTECYGCHRSDYEGTRDPDHQAAGFSTDCEQCHTTRDWEDATVNHDQFFRLTGAHRDLDCQACHASGYAGTPTDCYSCHRSDYDGTQDPNHRSAGFPTDCEQCHTTRGWSGADFNHAQFYRLTGAHRALECEACHADGYAGTPTDCYGCHRSDYESARSPNHQGARFPTDCELCHDTNSWEGADFSQHDSLYFPIYSGTHRGTWSACTDCHSSPSNFGVFECINCHDHRRSEMDSEHDDVAGYVYDSDACYSCHPTGRE